MKKILITVSALIVGVCTSPVFAAEQEAIDAANILYEGSITKLTADKTPFEATLTRWEAALLLKRFGVTFFEDSLITQDGCAFSDINKLDQSIQDEILKSCEIGLFKGVNGKFSPTANFTRGQIIIVVARLLNSDPTLELDAAYDSLLSQRIITRDDRATSSRAAPRQELYIMLKRIMDSNTDPVSYNDSVINPQIEAVDAYDRYNDASDATSLATGEFDVLELKRQQLISQLTTLRDIVASKGGYKGDTSLRDVIVDYINVQIQTTSNEEKQLIEIWTKWQSDEMSNEEIALEKKLLDSVDKKHDDAYKRVDMVQDVFSKKYEYTLTCTSNCGDSSVDSTYSDTHSLYTNDMYKFSLTYPKAREQHQDDGNFIVSFHSPTDDDFNENIGVTTEILDKTMTLDAYYAEAKKLLSDTITNFSEKEVVNTTLNSIPVKKVVFQGEIDGVSYQRQQYVIIRNRFVYVLTYTAKPNTFSIYLEDFEDIAGSFTTIE